jgi:hypothetical protein
MHLVASLDKQFSILYGLLKDHISENVDYKVGVDCCCHFLHSCEYNCVKGSLGNGKSVALLP